MGLDCLNCGFKNADQEPHNCLDNIKSQLDQVTQERDRLERQNKQLSKMASARANESIRSQLDQVTSDLKRSETSLKKLMPYAFHKVDCAQLMETDNVKAMETDCSCGYLKAI